MNNPFAKLRETSWRRELTPAEKAEARAWLKEHPEALASWEAEVGLSRALDRLPDVPVPSNFTARVLQAVQREVIAEVRQTGGRRWNWRSFLPKAGIAAAFAVVTLLSFREAVAAKRLHLAKSVSTVSEVASLPSPEILKDFDAIRQLNPTPPPDIELLALLK
jgi:hypothetical protein